MDPKEEITPEQMGKPRQNPLSFLFMGWILAYTDLKELLTGLQNRRENQVMLLGKIILSVTITWFIYVPIHELMHCAGCVITGGTVDELIMGREYGAEILQNVFPFIVPETSQYAGRLTGFEPAGDISYFICVLAPFFLTLFPGVWCFIRTVRSLKIWLLGPGLVIGLASFTNLTGDFFEMGTILSTRLIDFLAGGAPGKRIIDFWLLRSDDIFRLFGEIAASPDNYGLNSAAGFMTTSLVILLGFVFAVLLSGGVYHLGRIIALAISPYPAGR
jgi:hypothetical protein